MIGGVPWVFIETQMSHPTDNQGDQKSSFAVRTLIHPEDFLFDFHVRWQKGDRQKAAAIYLKLGEYSANLLKTDVVAEAQRILRLRKNDWSPDTILDFASGYGCVTRHLPLAFPTSSIHVCDIHPQAIEFCKTELGFDGFLSRNDARDLTIDRSFNFIFALSFFSHMPKRSFAPWLSWLRSRLNPGGVLAFTTRGEAGAKLANLEFPRDEDGFGFAPRSEQGDLNGNEYGGAISPYAYVMKELTEADFELLVFRQILWWNNQDLYVCTVAKPSTE